MKKLLTGVTIATAFMTQAQSVLNQDFKTPHETIPFSSITLEQYQPAFERGIKLAQEEIEAIASNPAEPTFENTIVALEGAGKDLSRVSDVFFPLLSADADDQMMAISNAVLPLLSNHSTSVILNRDLWKRVKAVYEKRDQLNLTPEEDMLLKRTYDMFALQGANLEGADREKFRELTTELSTLTNNFGQNVIKELNTYEIWLTADDLAGLPEGVVAEAAQLAEAKGRKGEFLFTLAQPTYLAFMKYSERPDLRERFYRLYCGRNIQGQYSNLENIKRISEIRLELARLLGAESFAQHSLKRTMAENPENVYKLLDQLREAYTPALKKEMAELNEFASNLEGHPVNINAWDYSYYSNKLKNERYSYDEEQLRPYFELDNVIDGVFGLATRLYGLQFTYNPDIEVYHPDVKAFEVTDANGEFIGVIYTDFFPRATKRPGAWMTGFSEQFIDKNGADHRPLVSIVMNFTKPTADKPSLLTPYEVETFLHEFGHALHGLLTRCKFAMLSGTSVYRDFVELPSQFNENYMTQKEFLDSFAKHYQTGEPIPAELVDKIIKSSQYGAAYACLRQLGFGYVDIAYHTITEPVTDPVEFERKAMEKVQIFPIVEGTMTCPTFSHIFSGGYAAGYYSYKWAEVLDADAFAAFEETGIFNPETAKSFRTNILEKGGTAHPAQLYRNFRGKDATIDALLIRDGIKAPETHTVPINKD